MAPRADIDQVREIMDTLREREFLRLVDEALGMSAADRAGFLERECEGNEALRVEVDAFLASDLEQWTLGAPDGATAIRDYVSRTAMRASPGETIQDFTLVEEIGSGGMGVVYAAQQSNPRRVVALKLLHTRLVGTGAGQRFAFESETLGQLRHPNIASILQAGTYEISEGVSVPWFAMELVEGALSITDYCHEHELEAHARLRLLVSVCAAIHHGHQLGVIHRDLKPPNVLVDGDGHVKVIDFSIAAATNRAESVTMLTRTGDLLGTLPYMSPEQVDGPRQVVDTRTDVYALGVLMFELLTGELPIDMTGLSLADSVRAIVEQPSRRPGSVKSGLARELDWIVLKALEKDPARRYASTSEMRADLERYLAGEAVVAGQPSVVYGAWKAVRRHPAVASVLGLLLVGSVAFGVFQARVAEDERAQAVRETRLKDAAVVLKDAALASAADAKAKQAVAHVLGAGIAAEQGNWPVVVDSLDQALALENGDAVALGLDRVAALVSMGDYAAAVEALDELEERVDVGVHAARFLFYGGIVALADKDERDEGLPLLDAALRGSLPPADAAFAQGMTAPTAETAIAAFREAIAIDPAHSLAWSGLLNALVVSGQLREAESMAESLLFRFPQDKRVHAYRVMFAGLSGDADAMRAALVDAEPVMSAAELRLLPTFAEWMLELDRMIGAALGTGGPSASFITKALGVVLSYEQQVDMDEEFLLGSVSAHQRFLVNSVEALSGEAGGLFGLEQLDHVIEDINPNPLLRFLRALVRTMVARTEHLLIAADFEAAAIGLDIFPNMQLAARLGVLRNRMNLWQLTGGGEHRSRALEAIRHLQRTRNLSHKISRQMASDAADLGVFDLSRMILSDWEQAAAGDLEPVRMRVGIEKAAGNWWAARLALGELLERLPEDSADRADRQQELAVVEATLLSQTEALRAAQDAPGEGAR